MKKLTLILFLVVFVLSVHSQIVVPLALPTNCNIPNDIIDVRFEETTPNVTLFPNPNDGTFTVNFKSPKVIDNVEIVIFNSLGVECYLQKVYCNSKNLIRQVEVSDLLSGVYYIKLRSKSYDLKTSFIIQK